MISSNTMNNMNEGNLSSGIPTLILGVYEGREGVLFRRENTLMRIDNWSMDALVEGELIVSLVHERGIRDQPEGIRVEIPLKVDRREGNFLVILPMGNDELNMLDNCLEQDILGYGKNKWYIQLVKGSHPLTAEISYICNDASELAKTPYEFLVRRYRYFARELELFSSEANLKLFSSLFNPNYIGKYEQFFGAFYPLTCVIKKRYNAKSNDCYEINGDGTNNASTLNSFSRFARIFMDLHLAKCLMVVKFDCNNDSEFKKKEKEYKKEYCLSFGIDYQGHKYKLFCTSNSGLKGSTCLFYNSTMLNLEALKDLLGTFEKAEEYSSVKVASRIGLSLGTSIPSLVVLKPDEIQYIKDEVSITDGAGMAVDGFFDEILENTYAVPYFSLDSLLAQDSNKRKERLFVKNYKKVSAMQIRHGKCKGVIQRVNKKLWLEILKKHNLPPNTKVIFRNSMVKFNANTSIYNKIDVLNVSSVQGGNITRSVMSCLLQMTDKPQAMEDHFRKIYETELDEIVKNKNNVEYIVNVLLSQAQEGSKDHLARKLLLGKQPLNNYFISSVINENIRKRFQAMISDRLSFKLRFKYSVNLMGVFDESFTLKEDEVYIPTSKLTKLPNYQFIDKVLVYRNPLSYEADIQCLKLVKNPPGEFLKSRQDVIVFGCSKNSNLAEPLCYMAGGDLDGDLFEIIFDPEIVQLFNPTLKPKLNYNEGPKKEPIKSAGFQMSDVRTSLFELMNTPSSTGGLYHKSIVWRNDSSPQGIETKKLISKLYHDSINSSKGDEFKNDSKIPYKESPQWLSLENVELTKDDNPLEVDFETRMYKLIKEKFRLTKLESSQDLEPCFENLSKKYEANWPRWKNEFYNTLALWNNYWVTKGSDIDILLASDLSLHKKKLLERIKECTKESKTIDWFQIFKSEDNGIELLSHKAAYWLYCNYEDFERVEYTEGLEKIRKKRMASPFVYTCCGDYLNLFLLNLDEEEMMFQLVSPEFPIRITQVNCYE